MDQEVRFCPVPGGRIAYATVGAGPPLVMPPLWLSHVELDWEQPEFRAFISTLAEEHTVIRYDRLGTGLSDRAPSSGAVSAPASASRDLRTLAALVDRLGLEEFALFGVSLGGAAALAYAAAYPRRVRSLALFGAFAHGEAVAPAPLREAMVATVRAHWGAGARVLADVWLPGASASLRDRFARLQRASVSAAMAAASLEAVYATDVRDLLPDVSAPVLVVHRRADRAIPYELGRDLAARLPNARLMTVEGDLHPPWLGASAPVLAALREFLGSADRPREHDGLAFASGAATSAAPRAVELSAREREVLALVGAGLADGEIAAHLLVSAHTVHRHVANIRTKLGQPSRAAAVAYAARRGLI